MTQCISMEGFMSNIFTFFQAMGDPHPGDGSHDDAPRGDGSFPGGRRALRFALFFFSISI